MSQFLTPLQGVTWYRISILFSSHNGDSIFALSRTKKHQSTNATCTRSCTRFPADSLVPSVSGDPDWRDCHTSRGRTPGFPCSQSRSYPPAIPRDNLQTIPKVPSAFESQRRCLPPWHLFFAFYSPILGQWHSDSQLSSESSL